MCASFLLIVLMGACASSLFPAARIMWQIRQMLEAQTIADSILESVRAEIEKARGYAGIYPYGGSGAGPLDEDGDTGEGKALELTGSNGCTMRISADGCRLLYRYDPADGGDGGYTSQMGEKQGRSTAAFPEGFYAGLYLDLRFLPFPENGYIQITARLGKRAEYTGGELVVRDVICTERTIADLPGATVWGNGSKWPPAQDRL